MAVMPAWKRKMTPSQRLEYEIQSAWRMLWNLAQNKGCVQETWRQGMLHYWAMQLRYRLGLWERKYGKPYKFTEPVAIDILRIRRNRNESMVGSN